MGLGEADWQAWKALEEIAASGQVGAIGVSNVGLDQLQELYEKANVKPKYVQNRCFAAAGWDLAVRDFCKSHDVTYQGFSLLTANAHVFRQQITRELVQRYRTTPAQLVFRFSKQIGMWPLTGTTDPAHMREDLDSFNEPMTESDLADFERAFVSQ